MGPDIPAVASARFGGAGALRSGVSFPQLPSGAWLGLRRTDHSDVHAVWLARYVWLVGQTALHAGEGLHSGHGRARPAASEWIAAACRTRGRSRGMDG